MLYVSTKSKDQDTKYDKELHAHKVMILPVYPEWDSVTPLESTWQKDMGIRKQTQQLVLTHLSGSRIEKGTCPCIESGLIHWRNPHY